MLRILDQLPEGLTALSSEHLADALGGPALIRVPGAKAAPLFVAVLLHGNETSGWDVIRRLLERHRGATLPRPIDLFVGNVHAACRGVRRLDGQPDYNRIWKGARGPEREMAARLMYEVRRRRPFASLDLHNTSGHNPLYACFHRRRSDHLALAARFADIAVLVERPDTLLAVAFADVAPSITLECGRPGNQAIERAVAERIDALLASDDAPSAPVRRLPATVLAKHATVRVPESVDVAVSGDARAADLVLPADLDRHNFRWVAPGTPLARVRPASGARLLVTDEAGRDVTERYVASRGDLLVTRESLMPSLLTVDTRIIRQDCLGYLMTPLVQPTASALLLEDAG